MELISTFISYIHFSLAYHRDTGVPKKIKSNNLVKNDCFKARQLVTRSDSVSLFEKWHRNNPSANKP